LQSYKPYVPAEFTPKEISWVTRPQGHSAVGSINWITPSWIEPATFRLVAQCLNQLLHRLTDVTNDTICHWNRVRSVWVQPRAICRLCLQF